MRYKTRPIGMNTISIWTRASSIWMGKPHCNTFVFVMMPCPILRAPKVSRDFLKAVAYKI